MKKKKFTPVILSAFIAMCSCIGTVYADDIPDDISELQQQANELSTQPTQPPVDEEQEFADNAKDAINEGPTGDNAEGANDELRGDIADKLSDDDGSKEIIQAASDAVAGDKNSDMVGSIMSKNSSISVPIIIAAVISVLAALVTAAFLFGNKKQPPAKNTDETKGGE